MRYSRPDFLKNEIMRDKKHRMYLVIWQTLNNDQSIERTPVDIVFYGNNSADNLYSAILNAVSIEEMEDVDHITILGIYKL